MSEASAGKRRRARGESFTRVAWRRYRKSWTGWVGLVFTGTFILVGILAPLLASENPLVCEYKGQRYYPAVKDLLHGSVPFSKHLFPQKKPFNLVTFSFRKRMKEQRGDWAIRTPIPWGPLKTSRAKLREPAWGDPDGHYLGTDDIGRDLLARMIHGARVSMMVGFLAVGISTCIGILMGSLAGYFGGWVDVLISRIIEIVMCFPVLFLILTILAIVTTPSIWIVMIVLGVVMWTGPARYVRGEFIRLRDSEYAIAARALGAGPIRLIFRHVLPNALAPLFVTVSFGIASAILLEAGLSYLGVGVQPPTPSWGNILYEGFGNILTTSHMIWPPSVAIFLGVLSYNLVGDALRDAIDPRLRT